MNLIVTLAFPLREALESLASHFITETTLSAGLVDIRASSEHEKRVARFKDLTNEGILHLEAPVVKRKRKSKDDERYIIFLSSGMIAHLHDIVHQKG